MAIFVNTDWASQSTSAAKLAKLNLLIGEVEAEMSANTQKDGAGRQVDPLVNLHAQLLDKQTQLMRMPDLAAGGGANVTRARFGRELPQ